MCPNAQHGWGIYLNEPPPKLPEFCMEIVPFGVAPINVVVSFTIPYHREAVGVYEFTLPKTKSSSLKISRLLKNKNCLPTINFHGQLPLVSGSLDPGTHCSWCFCFVAHPARISPKLPVGTLKLISPLQLGKSLGGKRLPGVSLFHMVLVYQT